MRPDEWKDRLRELVQKAGIFKIVIVILSGILLIFLSWGGMSEKDEPRKEKETLTGTETEQGNDLLSYQARMEEQVEDILGRAEGIDDVDVMITLRASREKVTLKDNKRDAEKSEEESVLTEDENKKTSPYVIQEVEPEIEGILVVCAGGDNPSIQREIIAGISALFPVESHKIKVMKSKEK
ncbi:MAG: hypothetical protein HFG34_09620 [Eubacterium sp.]|nr:hypothetical protein [Eubacterium sp.]